MARMALSDSKVNNDKSCSKTCLTNYEALKKQYDDLLVKLDDTGFKAATYKRGLSILEGQILKYKEHEVLFSEEIDLLKRSVGHKEYQMGLLRTELERQTPLDLSYSGLEEFKEPEVNEYGPRDSSLKPTIGCDKESNNSKENTDDSLEQAQKTDTETNSVKSSLKVDKDWKEKFFCPANHAREVEPKKARENNDAPIIEDWVSDNEDEVEPIPKMSKPTEEENYGCTNSGEARVQQRKRRIQIRVHQKQKDQEDEGFRRILLAKKMKSYYCWFKITAVGEKVNAAESLLVVSTELSPLSEDQESLGVLEDASKQGRSIADIDADVEVTLVDETQVRSTKTNDNTDDSLAERLQSESFKLLFV
ncbi:hypothetical protein Tco_0747851 [Tanacetum coccineum]|uniref:Uncharacterized protein n=1 Tax=Tanacetum coccineum TaxID=301880 RepID=A0ABQ4YWI1_9ASTR